MRISKRRLMLNLAIVVAAVLLVLAYLYLRFPIPTGHGDYYFTNYLRVYEREPQQSILFRLPDLFPFARDTAFSGADPFSFQYVGNFSFDPDPTRRLPPVSNMHTIYVGKPSSALDERSGSFDREISTADDIYRDKNHVIYQGKVVWDSDPNSLELYNGFAKDKKHVYLNGYVSTRLDPGSFELLGCGFYKDRNGVYNDFTGFEKVIAIIDKDTFEVLKPHNCHSEAPYNAKDKNHLYKADGVNGFRVVE